MLFLVLLDLPVSLCVSTLRDQLFMSFVTGSALAAGRNWNGLVPEFFSGPVSRGLQIGSSWARNMNRSGGFTCALRIVCTSMNPSFSPWDLDIESCNTESALGTGQEDQF